MKKETYHCNPVGDYWVAITDKPDVRDKFPYIVAERLWKELNVLSGEWMLMQVDNPNDIDKNNQFSIIAVSSNHPKAKELGLPTFEVRDKAEELYENHLKTYPVELTEREKLGLSVGIDIGYKGTKGFRYNELKALLNECVDYLPNENNDNIKQRIEETLLSLSPQIEVWW
jgi:hypothetical protein